MSKLLGNRRKMYILDITCSRFCFRKIQEEFLGQCSRQGIPAPRTEGLFVCSRKKQTGWLRKCFCKYTPLKFLGLSWKFYKNRRSQQVTYTCYVLRFFHKSVLHTLKIPRPKKRTPKLCGIFVDDPCKFHVFSNSLQEIPHAITFTRNQFHIFKPIVCDFFVGIV